MSRLAYFLLALVAELFSYLAFAWGFLRGSIRAAYERGYARGYESEAPQQYVLDEDT